MSLTDFITETSKKNEAARIVNGMAFLTELKKTAATYVPPQKDESYTPSPASSLNTDVGARQQFTSVSSQKGVAARGVGIRGGSAGAGRIKKATIDKQAFIDALFQGLKSDVKGLSAAAEGYREGLSQFRAGGAAKPDLGSAFDRAKAFITRKPTREQAAYAKGPDYYNAFIRAKNLQKGTGAADVLDEINMSMRNPQGNLTPMSVTRGALETGLITPASLKNIANKAKDYATGASREAEAAEKTKKLLQGAGLIGGGALAGGLLAKNMSSKNRNA
jgi:hypothetical protein